MVPLYARQSSARARRNDERLHSCGGILRGRDAGGRDSGQLAGQGHKSRHLTTRSLANVCPSTAPYQHADADAVTIIYTSGTSGEPKGVVLNASERQSHAPLHKFAARSTDGGCAGAGQSVSLHAFLLCRIVDCDADFSFPNSALTLSTDLTKLSDELKLASPNYFLNVPTLLERVRAKIRESIQKKGGGVAAIFARAQRAFLDEQDKKSAGIDRLCLLIARRRTGQYFRRACW